MQEAVNIFWFRRDLRFSDNAGLYHALKDKYPVLPVFIFDKNILYDLTDKADRRVEFIFAAISEMQQQLVQFGSSLEVYYGFPGEVFNQLISKYSIKKVFTNHDYEPYAKKRDSEISELLTTAGITFHTFKDHVIFEKEEVMKDDGNPYGVFSPYARKWLSMLNEFYLKAYPTEKYFDNFYRQPPRQVPTLKDMGFREVDKPFPSKELEEELVSKYRDNRNFPGNKGTSHIGVHLRFGTISIRGIARLSKGLSETFLNELIWRDFYQMALWNFPQIGLEKAFKPEYDRIEWRNNESEFEVWKEGMTGYPIVDAGMRELNETGFMHNRVRMIVASFLTKHLLIDWRWGKAILLRSFLILILLLITGVGNGHAEVVVMHRHISEYLTHICKQKNSMLNLSTYVNGCPNLKNSLIQNP